MICHFALIIALLCLEPSRGELMYFETIPKQDLTTKTWHIGNIDWMSEQASREIHESYLKSEKRLILLGDDGTIKPFMSKNSADDQERLTRALKTLSEDPKNEVWIITASDVRSLQQAYGHIRGLHLAGHKGTQLGLESARGITLPQPGPIDTELRDEADRIVASVLSSFPKDLGITARLVSQNDYFIEYAVPTKWSEGNSNVAEVKEMTQRLGTLVGSNEQYRGYGVEVTTKPTEYRVVLGHQEHYNKGRLANELVEKLEQEAKPIKFGLSIGGMQMDEPMHLAMKERGYHAIVVKGMNHMDDHVVPLWLTYASHRLLDYRESIKLLEQLAGILDHNNGNNELMQHVPQSLSGIGLKKKAYHYASSPSISYREYGCSYDHQSCLPAARKYINSCLLRNSRRHTAGYEILRNLPS